MDSVDVLVAILGKGAVSHHGVLSAIILIVNRNDHRMVVLNALAELECCQVVRIKLNLTVLDFLINAAMHRQVLDVVFAIRCVEHLGRIVRILLFRDAHIDSDMSIAESVILEFDLEFVAISYPLQRQIRLGK